MQSIKLFVCGEHDPGNVIANNEIVTPICCGAALSGNDVYIDRDDVGDNISGRYGFFKELTAQYWAWKNSDSDYYGFCRYNLYFSFNPKTVQTDESGYINFAFLNQGAMDTLCINDIEQIRCSIEPYDVVVDNISFANATSDSGNQKFPWETASYHEYFKRNPHLHIEDLDLTMQIISEYCPEYCSDISKYLHKRSVYSPTLFIMKKDLFFSYNKWLFNILFELERRMNVDNYSEEGLKTITIIGDMLCGVFIQHLISEDTYKIGKLQIARINDTSKVEILNPVFKDRTVNVVFSSDENFAPYCATAIQSLIDHASSDRNYDIIIMEKDMITKTKNKIGILAAGHPNISIRILNVRQRISEYSLYVHAHLSVETYFRLLITELMPGFDKALYLDGDIIIMSDVSELYDMDLAGNCLAGVLEVCLLGMWNGGNPPEWTSDYIKKLELKEENVFRYINAGILLMDLTLIRQRYSSTEMLKYAQEGNFALCDQDTLNALFQDEIMLLPPEWNTFPLEDAGFRKALSCFAPAEMYKASKLCIQNPKIIHYLGEVKPWHAPDFLMAYEFWNVARRTPFYEEILVRQMWQISGLSIAQASQPASLPLIKRIINKLLPHGSRRRNFIKKILGKN